MTNEEATADDRPQTTDRGPLNTDSLNSDQLNSDQQPTINDQPDESLAARLRKRRQG